MTQTTSLNLEHDKILNNKKNIKKYEMISLKILKLSFLIDFILERERERKL